MSRANHKHLHQQEANFTLISHFPAPLPIRIWKQFQVGFALYVLLFFTTEKNHCGALKCFMGKISMNIINIQNGVQNAERADDHGGKACNPVNCGSVFVNWCRLSLLAGILLPSSKYFV